MAAISIPRETVVGRTEELALLERFLATDVAEIALTIEGEAGIGKTTLWQAGVSAARVASYTVLSCRPGPAEVQLSYVALRDLLDGVVPEALAPLPEPQRRALAVALMLEPAGDLPAPSSEAISTGFYNVLRQLAHVQPVLVAVDDVQWLDSSSAALLEFAARRLEGQGIKLLLTERREADAPESAVVRAVADERRTRLAVVPLSLGATHRLLADRLDASVGRRLLVRVHETSGGNPFYALELARALEGSPDLDGGPLPVPPRLLDLVSDRLAGLSRRVRAVLEIVAALSKPTVARVESAAGANARAALDRAAAAGVVEFDGERIRFAHPLLAAAVERDLAPEERRRLHRKLADIATETEERARHLALAADGCDEAVAVALDAAAASARARGAPAAAAELSEQAWRLTPPERSEDVQRRKIEAAEQHVHAADLGRARVLVDAAVAALPPGPLRARGLVTAAVVQALELPQWQKSHRTLERALREARDDVRLRAELERQLGWMYSIDFQATRAEPHVRAALELAERLNDPVLLAEALGAYAQVEFQRGRGLRRDLFDRALALETLYDHRRLTYHPYFALADALRCTGDFAGARACLQTMQRVAVERGEEDLRPLLLTELGRVELAVGNWSAARRHADDAHAAALETRQEGAPRRDAVRLRACVDAYCGRVEPARRWAEADLLARPHRPLEARVMLGFLELSLRRPDEARVYLKPIAASARRIGVEDPCVFAFWPDAIEAFIGAGELEQAEPVLEWLEERGGTLDRPWAIATAARCRALLCAARGSLDEALATAEDALRAHDRFEQPFELARTQLVKGKIARRAKQKRVARQALEQALELLDGLGAVLWSKQAREELARIGGRPPSRGELTPAERRVAALVAEGRSNREVAAALFVTPRTVEWNLTKIYTKLGVRSRAELVRQLSSKAAPIDP